MKIRRKILLLYLFQFFYGIPVIYAEKNQDINHSKLTYYIDVKLFSEEKLLIGQEKFIYKNLSVDTLNYIYLHLYPNAFKNQSSA